MQKNINRSSHRGRSRKTDWSLTEHFSLGTWFLLSSGPDRRGRWGFRALSTTWLCLSFKNARRLPLFHSEQIRERIDAESLIEKESAPDDPLRDEKRPYIEDDKHDKKANVPPAM